MWCRLYIPTTASSKLSNHYIQCPVCRKFTQVAVLSTFRRPALDRRANLSRFKRERCISTTSTSWHVSNGENYNSTETPFLTYSTSLSTKARPQAAMSLEYIPGLQQPYIEHPTRDRMQTKAEATDRDGGVMKEANEGWASLSSQRFAILTSSIDCIR